MPNPDPTANKSSSKAKASKTTPTAKTSPGLLDGMACCYSCKHHRMAGLCAKHDHKVARWWFCTSYQPKS